MHLPRAAVLRDPLVALLSLAGLDVAARGLPFLVPAIGDPWSGGAAAPLNGELVRKMETDAGVVAQRRRLYVRDRTLFWRLAPAIDMQVENIVLDLRDGPLLWTIRTNDRGFRAPPVPPGDAGFQVLALGDSCTFGFRVDGDDT